MADTVLQQPAAATEVTERPLLLRLRPVLDLSEDQFFRLCQLNRDLRIERNAAGELLIMAPTGGGTGRRNLRVSVRLGSWAERDGTGDAFDSSTGFRLPNGAVRSPDAAWMTHSRLAEIPPEEIERFIPACPDFVLELRSPTDRLRDIQDKMAEYLANGARLGWLLDPATRRVYVYRLGAPVERLDDPTTLSGDPVLPGFALDLREIW